MIQEKSDPALNHARRRQIKMGTHFVNQRQTKDERQLKYLAVRLKGFPVPVCRRVRDFTWNHVELFLESANPVHLI